MLETLQRKWKVTPGRLILILITFAVGGSATGYVARKLLLLSGIQNTVVFIIAYVVLITILWPVSVLLISIPFGQFKFFRSYIRKLGKRVGLSGETAAGQTISDEMKPIQLSSNKEKAHQLVIFASGAGSNAEKIIRYFSDNSSVNIAMIACNKPGAGVIKVAERENIPVLHIEKERFFRGDGYLPELMKVRTDLIVLAGFLWKIPLSLIQAFPKKIINIHPALLPSHGGKGMYGQLVHEAVLASGDLQSGITVHYVDEHYDNGDIIFQTACPVLPGDSAETLAHRIHELEHLHYPRVIESLLNGTPLQVPS
jgi:formyltetrahydrofolate-dependent phosphoribosylglycinamide formyltransferase